MAAASATLSSPKRPRIVSGSLTLVVAGREPAVEVYNEPPLTPDDATEFPMNRSDPTFAGSDDSRFSCDYKGKHDHGEFLPQHRSPHEATLRFLEWARARAAASLATLPVEDKSTR